MLMVSRARRISSYVISYICWKVYAQLRQSGPFGTMKPSVDEEEHSIELQIPYVCHVMKGKQFKIVPILVGALDTKKEAQFGTLLAPFLDDPANFFASSGTHHPGGGPPAAHLVRTEWVVRTAPPA